jgi:hypothetical protein
VLGQALRDSDSQGMNQILMFNLEKGVFIVGADQLDVILGHSNILYKMYEKQPEFLNL